MKKRKLVYLSILCSCSLSSFAMFEEKDKRFDFSKQVSKPVENHLDDSFGEDDQRRRRFLGNQEYLKLVNQEVEKYLGINKDRNQKDKR